MAEWVNLPLFGTGEPITAKNLNDIGGNLNALYKRQYALTNVRNGTDFVVSGQSFTKVTGMKLELNVTEGKYYRVHVHLPRLTFSQISRSCALDILIDDITFMSSLDVTPATYGLCLVSALAVGSTYPASFMSMWKSTKTGLASMQLMAKFNYPIDTCTIRFANTLCQLFVAEV